ncbi:MAG: glycoside hydrolase family 9 protein [Cytophagales bacterium]|nr:glycoside hydrolase family 9 protein [Cytophagales bacterium]
MKVRYAILIAVFCFASGTPYAQKPTSDFIRIDQFGYRPQAKKVAVIVDPQTGYDANLSFNPSTGTNQYQVRKWDTDEAVFSGTLAPWNGGATDATSGDKAWWFDFSAVTATGSYYVFDVGRNVGSFKFDIREDVYADVLRVAVRMFYYNRCNHEKLAQHAGANWADGPSFVGANQDKAARSVTDRNNAATARDLSGGWWDAGDYNKYVTFARMPMHQLLEAYEENPSVWGDNYKIPESGNGIPDLLDELKWELDWLKKMQNPDGGSLVKMGALKDSDGQATLPPSTDPRPRYYYPGFCSSATITLAGVFAHAALVYKTIPSLTSYADDLKTRAVSAFNHYQANPKSADCDDGTIQAGDADRTLAEQEQHAVQAAVYLYALTNDNTYKQYVDANYTKVKGVRDNWFGPYDVDVDGALLYYTKLAGATPATVAVIKEKKSNTAGYFDDAYKFSEKDPYRSQMPVSSYHWGSLNPRGCMASLNYDMITYGLDPANHDSYRLKAEETLHYFHGVNPFNMVYMTNMATYGGEKSVDEVYHSWFKEGSPWDNAKTSAKGGPAPGYVPGGPNKDYKPDDGSACVLAPPCNQPVQKSYRSWNTVWPDASWEITEPAIYYQAAYIKALSKFATNAKNELPLVGQVQEPTATEKKNEIPANRLSLYPNPASGSVTVEYQAIGRERAVISVTDATGRMVRSQQADFQPSVGTAQLELQNVPPGVYSVRFATPTGQAVRKMVIMQ